MCTKPLSEAALELFGSWQDQGGVSIQRSRSWGIVTYADKWQWPSDPEQLLFPGYRRDCSSGHRSKDWLHGNGGFKTS